MATAIDMANQAGIAISCAIVEAGGHVMLLERMDDGRLHTVHSCTTKAVRAASNRRPTTAAPAARESLAQRGGSIRAKAELQAAASARLARYRRASLAGHGVRRPTRSPGALPPQ